MFQLATNLTVALGAMGVSIMATVTGEMGLGNLIQQLGPLVGLVVFFVWRDFKREKHLGKLLDIERDYNRNELSGLVKKSNKLMDSCARRGRDSGEFKKVEE